MTLPTTGSVASQPIGPLIYSLAANSFDGALALEHDGRRYALWYKGGLIVDAESPAPDDQLGRVLLQAGVLTNAQVGESIRRLAQSPNRRQLDILVEMGALQGDVIERAALMGLVKRALRMFAQPSATYAVEPSRHDRRGGGPIDCRWILYKGVRQFFDEKRLDRELHTLHGEAVKLQTGMDPYLEAFGFADEERIVLGYLAKGYWELPDLLEACMSLPRPVTLSVAYALWSSGCLDAQRADKVPRLRKRAREMTELVARPTSPPSGYVQPAGVTKELLFEGIPPAPSAPAAAAPTPPRPTPPPPRSTTPPHGASSLRRPTDPPRRPSDPPAPPKRQTGPGFDSKSPTTGSGSGPAPAAPKRQTGPGFEFKTPTSGGFEGRQITAGAAPGLKDMILRKFHHVEAGADHFQVLEVERTAAKEVVKTQYFTLAKMYHPDRLALVKLDEMRPQVDRIFARLSEAFSTLSDDGKRRAYMEVLARGGEAAVKRREDDEAAQAARLIGAEEQFRLGEMALRRQLYQQALEAFGKAVELNPDDPEHQALYHWAVFCAAQHKETVVLDVKKGLLKALEHNHKCIAALYYLGQIYNHLGDENRAYNAFNRLLSEQPDHIDAEREIRVIDMRRKNKKKR